MLGLCIRRFSAIEFLRVHICQRLVVDPPVYALVRSSG